MWKDEEAWAERVCSGTPLTSGVPRREVLIWIGHEWSLWWTLHAACMAADFLFPLTKTSK